MLQKLEKIVGHQEKNQWDYRLIKSKLNNEIKLANLLKHHPNKNKIIRIFATQI